LTFGFSTEAGGIVELDTDVELVTAANAGWGTTDASASMTSTAAAKPDSTAPFM
jgi:hypothetical protein